MEFREKAKGHSQQITSLVFPNETNRIFTSSRDGKVISWEVSEQTKTFTSFTTVTRHTHFVQEVAVDPTQKYVATACWDSTIRIHERETQKEYNIMCESPPLSIAFLPGQEIIASGHRNGEVRCWSLKGDLLRLSFHSKTSVGWVSQVRVPPPGCVIDTFVSAGWDDRLAIWSKNDLDATRPLSKSRGPRGPKEPFIKARLEPSQIDSTTPRTTGLINAMVISPDGSLLATGGKGDIRLYDLNESKLLYSLKCPHMVYSLVYSPTRYWLCAALSNHTIRIWDLENKQAVIELNYTEHIKALATCIEWHPQGEFLYSGHTDGTIAVWERVNDATWGIEQWENPAVAPVAEWAVEPSTSDWDTAAAEWDTAGVESADWAS